MIKDKSYLVKNLWNREDSNYHTFDANMDLFKTIPYESMHKYFLGNTFLDIGCGNGVKTEKIFDRGGFVKGYGVDISSTFIKEAKKTSTNIDFICCDIESLPFQDNYFDFVHTGFVLEHVQDIHKVLDEMWRVTKVGGHLFILCPNYGSPNRISPPFRGSKFKSFLRGLTLDFKFWDSRLQWNRVEPLSNNKDGHISDFDTTIEPYINTLIRYSRSKGFIVKESSSLWDLDTGKKLVHRILRLLGKMKLYPFKYWGPQALLILEK